jgi:hypothetical protein
MVRGHIQAWHLARGEPEDGAEATPAEIRKFLRRNRKGNA